MQRAVWLSASMTELLYTDWQATCCAIRSYPTMGTLQILHTMPEDIVSLYIVFSCNVNISAVYSINCVRTIQDTHDCDWERHWIGFGSRLLWAFRYDCPILDMHMEFISLRRKLIRVFPEQSLRKKVAVIPLVVC
jgi:hypothetical protein